MKIDKIYFQLFFLILLSVGFVFSLTKLGTFAYETAFAEEDTYTDQTYIGSILVEGLTKQEARIKLETETSNWQQSSNLVLSYSDEEVMIPSEIIHFFMEDSITGAENGVSNPLLSEVDSKQLGHLLSQILSKELMDLVNVDELKVEIENSVRLLQKEKQIIPLVSFMPELSEEILSSTVMDASFISELAEPISVQIDPKRKFSFLEDLASQYPTWSDERLTTIASALYEASLDTNLQVIERQTSKNRPIGIKLGLEAKIKRDTIDFSLKNPNDFPLQATFQSLKNGELKVSIKGYPLSKKYNIRVVEVKHENEEESRYRTIVQYSYHDINEYTKQIGKNDEQATIYRDIYDANGDKIETETISEDYYFPVNKIIVRPVLVEVEEELNEEGIDGNVSDNSPNNNLTNDQSNTGEL